MRHQTAQDAGHTQNQSKSHSKGQRTREKILLGALKIFSRDGFMASFQAIADHCGLTQANVLYHFPTKNNLIQEAIGVVLVNNSRIVADSAAPTDSALARIQKHFKFNLKWALDFPEQAQVILLLYYMASVDDHFSKIYGQVLRAARGKIEMIILAGQREHQFSKTVNVLVAAEILHDSLLGAIVNVITVDSKNSLKRLAAKADILFQQLLMKATSD